MNMYMYMRSPLSKEHAVCVFSSFWEFHVSLAEGKPLFNPLPVRLNPNTPPIKYSPLGEKNIWGVLNIGRGGNLRVRGSLNPITSSWSQVHDICALASVHRLPASFAARAGAPGSKQALKR